MKSRNAGFERHTPQHSPSRRRSGAAALAGRLRAGTAIAAFAAVLCAPPVLAADPARPAPARPSATLHAAIDLDAAGGAGSYDRHLAQLINEYRRRHGLGPLELAADLSAIAARHSTEMAQLRRLSHDGFMQRFDRTGAQICVENVGVNFPHAEAQLDGWRASPGHHRNLLEPKVARMGIAKSRQFVTFFACS